MLHEPAGDQPNAIHSLVNGVQKGIRSQVLLGATGTGKTFTIAKVIDQCNKPTLVLAQQPKLHSSSQSFSNCFQITPLNILFPITITTSLRAYVPSSDNYIPKRFPNK